MRSIVVALVVATWCAAARASIDASQPVEPLRLSAGARVVVFAPHPDDETIAGGGLLHRMVVAHATVQVVFVTNGDGYPDAVRQSLHRPPRRTDYLAYGRLRQHEALAADKRLGIPRSDVDFLGFPDGGIDALWAAHWTRGRPYTSPYTATDMPPYGGVVDPELEYDGQDLIGAILRILETVRPTIVILPHPDDVHPDHAATARFVVEAVDRLQHRHVLPHDVEMLAYLVHDPAWPPKVAETAALPPPARIHDTRWVALPLSPAEQAAKKAALHEYGSQLAFMPDLLGRFLHPNELFGRVDPSVLARIAASH
jgi:N-acetyl-1-D-myo-inositol-2-amino-2-deoxy-alpha-D-glucopyranoside deacetylase